jgi:3-hydroxyacyl-CoA dehydrogenase
VPAFVEQMLAKGLVGEKAGQGFYKRVKGSGGESEILTLDRSTLEYVPRQSPRLPALESARAITDVGERIKTLFNGNDRVGQFLRETIAPTLVYAAQITPAVAQSADDVDRVMRWGFGWDLGPFEMADAIGVDRVIEVARQVSPKLLERGIPELWKQRTRAPASELQILKNAKDQSRIVQKNAGRQSRGHRRRRAGDRVPQQDERDRLRHAADAARPACAKRSATSPRSSSATMRRTSPPAQISCCCSSKRRRRTGTTSTSSSGSSSNPRWD